MLRENQPLLRSLPHYGQLKAINTLLQTVAFLHVKEGVGLAGKIIQGNFPVSV